MPMVWNTEADAKLFAAVLATCDVKLNYGEMAKYMGNDCTAKAITHRITNIKKIAKDFDPAAIAATPAATGTPRKRKNAPTTANGKGDQEKARPVKKPRAPAKGGKKKQADPVEQEDGDEDVMMGHNGVKDESDDASAGVKAESEEETADHA